MGEFELKFSIGILDRRVNTHPLYNQLHSFKETDENWANMLENSVKDKVKSLLIDLVRRSNLAENAENLIDSAEVYCNVLLKDRAFFIPDEMMCGSLDDHVKFFRLYFSDEKEMVLGVFLVIG